MCFQVHTHILSYDCNEVIEVYPPNAGESGSLLPIAPIVPGPIAQTTIAVDLSYLYIVSAGGNILAYQKYDPAHPYGIYRKPLASTQNRR